MGVVNLVLLECLLRATTKKRSSTISGKKSAPQKKILTMPMLYALGNAKKSFHRLFNCIFGKIGRAVSEHVAH